MLLDTLISPDQVLYEENLLQNAHDETLWLDYYEAYGSDFEKAVFILDRAVSELPASTLLWNAYLQLPWGPEHQKVLINLYERALLILNSTPAFWFKYIDLLAQDRTDSDKLKLRRALDMALFNLDRSHHGKIWTIYLNLEDEVSSKDSAKIYARFFEVLLGILDETPAKLKEDCILKIAGYGDLNLAIKLFKQLSEEKLLNLRLNSEFILDFLQICLGDLLFRDDFFMESLAQNSSADYPEFAKRYLLLVAAYYSARENLEKARHFHSQAFKVASTVIDVVDVFDTITNWEENQIEKLYQAQNLDELQLRMKLLSRLLDMQPVLINDVLIKGSPHCLDHWLSRADIFRDKNDQREVINTYVTAIRRVNPLKATSKNCNTMASLWIKYAEIYISQDDLSTANIIFSHAVKSQFKTVSELAELYIAWTEMIFTVSDEDALNHVELVLFVSQDVSSTAPEKWEKKSAHDQVSSNRDLWDFYIDILKSMVEEGGDNTAVYQKLSDAYNQLLTLQIISLRLLLDYAEFMDKQEGPSKSYTIFEAGIRSFKSPQAQFYIWVVYLDKVIKNVKSDDIIRDLFDRCLSSEIPGYQAYDIYQRYYVFETGKGNLVRGLKIIRDAITYLTKTFGFPRYTKENRNKIADDKFLLYKSACRVIRHSLHDIELYRKIMSEALRDIHLTLPCGIELGLEFIDFENGQKELPRARALFKYLSGLGHPDAHVMKNVWEKWEKWEVENGTEESYKDLLKTRRRISNEYKSVSDLKADINPMGFVLGETKAPVKEEVEPKVAKNPDVIELDMDM